MTTTPLTQLEEVLLQANALPVLFVGSGMSRRYLGSPDWDGLLQEFGELTGRGFPYYRGLAGNDRPKMASLIARDFYAEWFDSDTYESSRTAFMEEVEDVGDPLKYEVAKKISALTSPDDETISQELDALSQAKVHAVITTNWDALLEGAFSDMEVFIGQQDVLFTATQGVGEIYKIHGCISNPKSIILTSEDYGTYWERNPYLIAKLLTMLVEHPVIFLGYSLGDAHVNKMLSNLVAALTPEQIAVLNDQLIFVRRSSSDDEPRLARSSLTVGAHTLNIREYVCDDFHGFYEMLGRLPRRFSVKLLRQLRESVYELAFGTEPSDRIHVLPFDSERDLDQVELVLGVGTMERLGEKGYSPFNRADLFRDMLKGKTEHDSDALVNRMIPRVFRGPKYCPIYYPLMLAGRLDESGNVTDETGLPANARALLGGQPLRPYFASRESAYTRTFRDLLGEDVEKALDLGLICLYEEEDVLALRSFLSERIGSADRIGTMLAKLGCKYDRLVYGPDFNGDRERLHDVLGVELL